MSDIGDLADGLKRHREAAILTTLPDYHKHVIIVAGAYEGATMKLIHEFSPRSFIVGYEPQPWAYERCREAISGMARADVFNEGLGVEDGTFPMYEWGTDAASFLPLEGSRDQGVGKLVDAIPEIKALLTDPSDMTMVLNMEGYEWKLIPYLNGAGILPHRLLVQSHFPTLEARLLADQVVDGIHKTHRLAWSNGMHHAGWQYWVHRDAEWPL